MCFCVQNRAVLECFTRDNVVANGVPLHNCHLIDGDWKNCAESLEGKRYGMSVVCLYARVLVAISCAYVQ